MRYICTASMIFQKKLKRSIQSEAKSDDPEGHGFEKLNIPSNIIGIYTGLEFLLGIHLSGHTDFLSEASNLIIDLYIRVETLNEKQYGNALEKLHSQKMELPKILLEQIAFNTSPKNEEHMLIVMDKSKHKEHLSQPLQTIEKRFQIAVTFLTVYNGILNIANKYIKF